MQNDKTCVLVSTSRVCSQLYEHTPVNISVHTSHVIIGTKLDVNPDHLHSSLGYNNLINENRVLASLILLDHFRSVSVLNGM